MDSKICTRCNIEKISEEFYKKYTESKNCNSKRSSKRDYENKEKISNQKKEKLKKIEIRFYKNKRIDEQNYKKILRSFAD